MDAAAKLRVCLVAFLPRSFKHYDFSLAADCNKNWLDSGDSQHRFRCVRTALLAALFPRQYGAALSHICHHLYRGGPGIAFSALLFFSGFVESRGITAMFPWVAWFLFRDVSHSLTELSRGWISNPGFREPSSCAET